MAENTKVYWKGLEELTNDTSFVRNAHTEFGEVLPEMPNNGEDNGTQRRDFLKTMGFGLAAASLAACEAPVKKAIPFITKPEEYDPSVANFYASSFVQDGEYCSILVKTREGRPIKIEGNTLSSVTRGGTSAKVQASVLSLYDKQRFRGPQANKKLSNWTNVDSAITSKLREISAGGGQIALVSNTIASPTALKAIGEFVAAYPGTKHIQYDALSSSGILDANQQSFGKRALPNYHFGKADVVVSIGADFLGTWLSPIQYAKDWSVTRKVGGDKKTMSQLFVFESNLSLTGSNADYRFPVRVNDQALVVAALYNAIAGETGGSSVSAGAPSAEAAKGVAAAAKALLAARGRSIVVSGSNDANVQVLVNAINSALGNYAGTIDLNNTLNTKKGSDSDMLAFVQQLSAGGYGAVLFYGVNPVYDHPQGEQIKAGIAKTALSVSFSSCPDETTEAVAYVCPDHHYLESWGDLEPITGHYSLQQPTISPLFKTRQVPQTLLVWAGNKSDYFSYLQANWQSTVYPKQKSYKGFREFWNYTLHDGIFEEGKPVAREIRATTATATTDSTHGGAGTANLFSAVSVPSHETTISAVSFTGDVSAAGSAVAATYGNKPSGFDLVIYEKVGIGSGAMANNPWLQELPDPVTRACWDNYITVSPAFAKEKGIKVDNGQTTLLEVTAGGKKLVLPAIVAPGQAVGTFGVALGYGRTVAGPAAKEVGKSAYPFIQVKDNALHYAIIGGVDVKNTGDDYEVAHVQTHHTIMGRNIVQEATLTQYQKDPAAGLQQTEIHTAEGAVKASNLSLWKMKHEYKNHSWGMVVDLNSCIGCGACVVSCNAENNVPVVGKKEVLNRREMHWMRIDRYFSSDGKDLASMEEPAANPEVVFQPLMCQHCNNAPCETVCPVLATTHSSEGVNQMTYNRCIGTRYCANNCPYKVRRFNWFSYPQNADRFPNNPANDDLGRMVLNPDVTVRARGVMEKCSLCVQRIQEGKLYAKKEKRRPIDGEVISACAQACPTDAIIFGDMNDPESRIAQLVTQEENKRNFRVLDEINTRPQVSYLTKIRNKA